MAASAKWLARAFRWVLQEEARALRSELEAIQDPARRARALTFFGDICRTLDLEAQ